VVLQKNSKYFRMRSLVFQVNIPNKASVVMLRRMDRGRQLVCLNFHSREEDWVFFILNFLEAHFIYCWRGKSIARIHTHTVF
jgi:hypothetical protein